MKFSVWPSSERPWDEVAQRARSAEQQGWHGLWYPDHLMPNTEDGEPADGPVFECWSILAGLAAITERLRLGALVSPVTFHHPVVLANRAFAVDHISNGRAVLGLGAGWQVNEHSASGVELPAVGERVARFEEAIEIISRMRTQARVTVDGHWFKATNLPADPKPVGPLPIVVGTSGARMSRATARWAEEWNTWGDVDLVSEKTGVFDRACEQVGRDPKTVWRSAQAMVFFVDDDATATRIRERAPAGRVLIGSAAQLLDELNGYAALGVDEFIVPDFNHGGPESVRTEFFDRFWNEVATKF